MPGSPDGGVGFIPPGPEFKAILDASGGTTGGVVRELRRRYEGQRLEFISNWWRRVQAVCSSVELPDNTSFGFHRMHVGVLATSVTFALVFPLGAAAIVVLVLAAGWAALRRTDAPRSPVAKGASQTFCSLWLDRRASHLAVLAYLPVLFMATTLVNSQARYRIILVPFFICYSGVFVGLAIHLLARRSVARLGVLAAAAGLIWLAQWKA